MSDPRTDPGREQEQALREQLAYYKELILAAGKDYYRERDKVEALRSSLDAARLELAEERGRSRNCNDHAPHLAADLCPACLFEEARSLRDNNQQVKALLDAALLEQQRLTEESRQWREQTAIDARALERAAQIINDLKAEQQRLRDEIGRETELRRVSERHVKDLQAALNQKPYPDEYGALADENARLSEEREEWQRVVVPEGGAMSPEFAKRFLGHCTDALIKRATSAESTLAILSSSLEGIAGEMEQVAGDACTSYFGAGRQCETCGYYMHAHLAAKWLTKLRTLLSSITQQTGNTEKSKS